MFHREKGFYVSLACAALAVVALGAVCYKVASPEEDKQSVASEESKAPAPTATIWARETVKQPTAKPSATPKATKKAVKTNAKPVTEKLHFSGKLQWPVKGEVLMKYSGDKVVYFKTLAEYRVNESLVIAAKAGTQVKTASRGKVTQIVDSEETGRTIVMDLGDGYSASYGPLKKIQVKTGEIADAGQTLGEISEATKYYSLEGDNLNFCVKKDGGSIDPQTLMKD